MRAGGYTVHQALSADAATVLKLAVALARRRGHAQLTPLHVAFTLLRSPSSPSDPPPFGCCPGNGDGTRTSYCAYGLLRRACGRAHPAAAPPHPLQCRALELCFNVALNRLPVTNAVAVADASATSSISASLSHPDPTLSNALVAALKRAQANQRRGCSVEPQPTLQMQQQQPPLLAIKVELDQLIISILDDPSVSRVMREAGFSSNAVKASLEEEGAMMLPTCLGHHVAAAACVEPPHIGAPWPPQQFSPCKEEDVRAIMEVMVRRQGRTNPVVVGDTASVAEAAVAELVRCVEAGRERDVPDELRGARVLRLHLSYVHLRLMTRADVDAQVADLRRAAHAVVATAAAGLVVYVGDMRWAIDDDHQHQHHALSAEDHMVAELARLMSDLRAASRGRAWLVAAASYQTYMRCKRRAPSLEAAWSLQPVVVPADGAGIGLALGVGGRIAGPPAPAPSSATEDGRIKLSGISKLGGDDCVPALCAECADGYEKEASLVRAKADGTTLALTYFPGWPQANEPQTSHKAELMELRWKWSNLCQRVHPRSHTDQPSIAPPMPWWCSTMNRDGEAQTELNDPTSAGLRLSFGTPADHRRSESKEQGADTTTLNLLSPDSATAAATYHDTRGRWSEGVDGELAVQGFDAGDVDTGSGVRRRVWLDELLFSGDLKRKAEDGRLSSEPKRRRGVISLDLNLCADGDEEDDDEEEAAAPSDLTNEGQSDDVEPGRRRVNDCVDSHK
uniref:Clp R domain-containing protein n=1 Tax=Leersia perrieri TaxID=77586 RepID=A0A0D9VFS4_9ORYZ